MLTFPVSHWGGETLLPPVIVGTAGSGGTPGAPNIATVSQFCPAGALVMGFAESLINSTYGTMTDSRGNTWNLISRISDGGSSLGFWWSILTSALNIGDTIQVTPSQTCTLRFARVFRNVVSSPIDLTPSGFTAVSTAVSQTQPSLAYEPEVVFAFLCANTEVGGTPPTIVQGSGGFVTLSIFQAGVLSYRLTRDVTSNLWTATLGPSHSGYYYTGAFVSAKLNP